MINKLCSIFYRPEKGWDPVPKEHADNYATGEFHGLDTDFIELIERWLGGFAGKRILDLGGGPGQYSVAFAQRGGIVTWHDISRTYMEIAKRHADDVGVTVEFSMGYMEDARKFIGRPFDFVFNRICWNYCMNDAAFAKLIYALVKPGGGAYIDSNPPAFDKDPGLRKLMYALNKIFSWKIGHPFCPHGRIARLIQRNAIEYMIIDYSSKFNDKIFFRKAAESSWQQNI